jgi:hypothetical protein
MTNSEPDSPSGTIMTGDDSGPFQNRWTALLLILVPAALLAGLGLTVLPEGPLRSAFFWLTILIAVLMIVGGVGWGYTEIRYQERLSQRRETNLRRVVGYLGVLAIVATIAVGGAMVPSRLAPVVWMVYVPIWLAGGWWLRRRRGRSSHARGVRT